MATIDNILLEQARELNALALAEIYDRYAESIYRYLYRYLGDVDLAEDLTSEVFLKLLQALDSPRAPRKQLQGWLYRVAHNLAMDHFRQQAKRKVLEFREELVESGDSPSAKLEKHQRLQQLRVAISQLTPSQQQVLLLRFGEGLPIAEVGQMMGKSEGAIKLLQYRAVKCLRRLLDREEEEAYEMARGQTIRGIPAASSAGQKN